MTSFIFYFSFLSQSALAAEFFEGQGFYLGDLHAHTGVSGDGGSSDLEDTCTNDCAALADVKQTALDNGLDFMTLSEHVNGNQVTTNELYAYALEAILDSNDVENGFITLPGAEVWFGVEGGADGHKTLLMFGSNDELSDLEMEDLQHEGGETADISSCEAIWEYAKELSSAWGPALLIPHHPGLSSGMGTKWECHNSPEAQKYSPAVETYSEHGNSMDTHTNYDVVWNGTNHEGTVSHALDPEDGEGLRIGYVGGTDSHDTRPGGVCATDGEYTHHPYGGGLTVAVLDEDEEFTRSAIYSAISERRTYVTSGPLMPAVVEYNSGGVYLGGMGEEVGMPEGQDLDVEVRVPAEWSEYVTSVQLRGNGFEFQMQAMGEGVFVITVNEHDLPDYVYPMIVLDGEAWYEGVDCDDGGDDLEQRIWLSPTWLDGVAADLDSDGYTFEDGDCADDDPSVSPGAAEVCYGNIDADCDGLIGPRDPDCANLEQPWNDRETIGNDGEGSSSSSDFIEDQEIGEPNWIEESGPQSSPRGCSTINAATSFLPALLGLGLIGLRRREDTV